ncbi:twin-arginine translocation signal domain-containing protein [Halorussus halophilus]|uniref:twin-arginine translocation signal domain-containing protein n=1 Tax=Halorussus halophilus TaxID=2650975 RepID=UPI001301238A|nr:twin-arginine translocation signal domain-containing protein [Halorussus halophilus]
MPRKLTRRRLLAGVGAAGAVALAGCTSGEVEWSADSGDSNGSDSGDGGEDGGDVDVNVSAGSDGDSS